MTDSEMLISWCDWQDEVMLKVCNRNSNSAAIIRRLVECIDAAKSNAEGMNAEGELLGIKAICSISLRDCVELIHGNELDHNPPVRPEDIR